MSAQVKNSLWLCGVGVVVAVACTKNPGEGDAGSGGHGPVDASGGNAGQDDAASGGDPHHGQSGGGDGAGATGGDDPVGQCGEGGEPPGEASGAGGSRANGECKWTIDSSVSRAIPTVGIVEWSCDLSEPVSARVEFRLEDAEEGVLNTGSGGPISLEGSPHRALLLGLKAERHYSYRIFVQSKHEECASPEQRLVTGARPETTPQIDREAVLPEQQAVGFIINSPGFANLAGPAMTYVLDADGEVVWWAKAQRSSSRALMNWEGTEMWSNATNVVNDGGGAFDRTTMDGLETERITLGLRETHHDFTVAPGGVIAALAWQPGSDEEPSEILERAPDGTLTTVAVLDESAYLADNYHANSIQYHREDDTYTVGDRNPRLLVKVNRQGDVVWQLGGNCDDAPAPQCVPFDWHYQHGHHLQADGRICIFTNTATSTIEQYQLTESGSVLSASPLTTEQGGALSPWLGDVQRLSNDNVLIAISDAGQTVELSPTGEVVQRLSAAHPFGYVNFRQTLYGPPQR